MSAVLLVSLLIVPIAQAEQKRTPAEGSAFLEIRPTIRGGIKKVLSTTVGDVVQVFTENDHEVVGWKEVHIPGKPFKECLGPDKNLNEEVLRCRNGYTRRVPVYSQ